MKRSGPLRRKKGIRRESATHRARRLEVKPFRDEYLEAHPRCAVFPGLPSRERHEITNGPNRQRALDQPAAILAVSRKGHKVVQHEHIYRQCARKLLVNPEEFNLDVINKLLAPKDHPDPPKYVELKDVVRELMLAPPSAPA